MFAVSPILNLLTLTSSLNPAAEASTYHILPLSAIQNFSVISLPSPPAQPRELPSLDHSALQSRLDATISRLKAEDARKGKGVTREAQDIFDRISRTLPTRWEGKDIVVSDAVIIETPYRSEDCRLITGAAKESLGRVKKVVSRHNDPFAAAVRYTYSPYASLRTRGRGSRRKLGGPDLRCQLLFRSAVRGRGVETFSSPTAATVTSTYFIHPSGTITDEALTRRH